MRAFGAQLIGNNRTALKIILSSVNPVSNCNAASLMKKGVLISTTEHLLSAFIGAGIDNAIIELDNLELPILDGSALPFLEAIQRIGLRRLRRPRTYWKVKNAVEVRESDKFIGVYPADHYSVAYTINFPH